MDDDKIERTIEIILQNQAQFYADLQEIRGVQKEAVKRTNVLDRACLNLYNTTVEQSKQITQVSANVEQLREAQKETDERLNAVIHMAEKFFSSRNRNSENKQ